MKTLKIFIFLAILLAGGLSAFWLSKVFLETRKQASLACLRRAGQDKCFNVEIAKTPAERERGLMFRAKLGENAGMLFIFEKEGIYPFWMKNTLISLDIIWIDKNFKVVYFAETAKPCPDVGDCPLISPGVLAKYVLEINGGSLSEENIRLGDAVYLILD